MADTDLEPFGYRVAQMISSTTSTKRFGQNMDVDIGTESIWTSGGLYPFATAASLMDLSSSSVLDTAAGTGVRTVSVSGLDANYNEISETVALNGLLPVTTVNQYLRVFRIASQTAGSTGVNQGSITCRGTGLGKIYNVVLPGDNAASGAFYTVPAGYWCFIVRYHASAGAGGADQYQIISLYARSFGGLFNLRQQTTLKMGGNSSAIIDFDYPIRLDEKSDIDLRSTASANNMSIAGGFTVVLKPKSRDPSI